ncbi:hypothetical protein BKA70DRAFT_208642 [Coprinopsis sp. MPI-PUGE-AT-0042]|nr:hypothetical protein BKA70DRAFT_208642 [Coprinopsis sp. MPI-PUGE-AT-0042]
MDICTQVVSQPTLAHNHERRRLTHVQSRKSWNSQGLLILGTFVGVSFHFTGSAHTPTPTHCHRGRYLGSKIITSSLLNHPRSAEHNFNHTLSSTCGYRPAHLSTTAPSFLACLSLRQSHYSSRLLQACTEFSAMIRALAAPHLCIVSLRGTYTHCHLHLECRPMFSDRRLQMSTSVGLVPW